MRHCVGNIQLYRFTASLSRVIVAEKKANDKSHWHFNAKGYVQSLICCPTAPALKVVTNRPKWKTTGVVCGGFHFLEVSMENPPSFPSLHGMQWSCSTHSIITLYADFLPPRRVFPLLLINHGWLTSLLLMERTYKNLTSNWNMIWNL